MIPLEHEVIMAFDLSTTCTGVVLATFDGDTLLELSTRSISPSNISPTSMGYLKTKQKTKTKRGEDIFSYVVRKGEIVSKTEKKRRDILIKRLSEENRLLETAKAARSLVVDNHPTLILMEANMAFRNIDVTRQLAEVAGVLQAISEAENIPLEKIQVATARAHWNLSKECTTYARTLTERELRSIDLTKETLKNIMLGTFSGYKLNKDMTTDESDALVLLHHWMKTTGKKLRGG